MAPREPEYFEHLKCYDGQMDTEDFIDLESDVFSTDTVYLRPEEEFVDTVDEWWADFLSDIIS